jgi:hypothetical protein
MLQATGVGFAEELRLAELHHRGAYGRKLQSLFDEVLRTYDVAVISASGPCNVQESCSLKDELMRRNTLYRIAHADNAPPASRIARLRLLIVDSFQPCMPSCPGVCSSGVIDLVIMQARS